MNPKAGRRFLLGGAAVAAAGVLTIIVNAGLTPLFPSGVPFAETAASPLFMWRQALSALAALLLLAGTVPLHRRQGGRAGAFGAFTFAMAFVGSACLFATEWAQVFFVRGIAQHAPDALTALEASDGPTPFDLGALIALLSFTLGWLGFSFSMLLTRELGRLGPGLVIAGFLSTPILGGLVPGIWGLAAGNVLLGAGLIVLGLVLSRPRPVRDEKPVTLALDTSEGST